MQNAGFNEKQISEAITYKQYNNIIYNGKKYPRQFAMITYIKLYVNKKQIEDLKNFVILNNCRKFKNTISNGETTIEYIEVETLPTFPKQMIGLSLLKKQKNRTEQISENIYIKVNGKKADLIFKN